jgi:hypothetical protein
VLRVDHSQSSKPVGIVIVIELVANGVGFFASSLLQLLTALGAKLRLGIVDTVKVL